MCGLYIRISVSMDCLNVVLVSDLKLFSLCLHSVIMLLIWAIACVSVLCCNV